MHLIGKAVRNFFKPPVQCFCVKHQPEEKRVAGYTKHMEKDLSGSICMMQANLQNWVLSSVPDKRLRIDTALGTVKNKAD